MPKVPTPETCANLSIAGGTWPDALMGLRDYFNNSATEWSLKHDGVDGSGDEGITLTPNASKWDFDANFRYVSGDGRPYAQCGHDGAITDPNNPVSSGSDVSPNVYYTGPSSPGIASSVLVAEWKDAVVVLFKDTNENYIHGLWGVGRFIEPGFASYPSRGVTGLSTVGHQYYGDEYEWFQDGTNSPSAYFHSPNGWLRVGATDDWYGPPTAWNNIDAPFFEQLRVSREDFGYKTPIGNSRYIYQYHSKKGSEGITTIKDESDNAFIFLNHGGNETSRCVAWDGSVPPV